MVEAELVAVASYLARYIEQKEQAFQVLMLAKHAADGNLSLALEIASEEMEELASDDAGGSFQGAACGVGQNPGRDGCEKASGEGGERERTSGGPGDGAGTPSGAGVPPPVLANVPEGWKDLAKIARAIPNAELEALVAAIDGELSDPFGDDLLSSSKQPNAVQGLTLARLGKHENANAIAAFNEVVEEWKRENMPAYSVYRPTISANDTGGVVVGLPAAQKDSTGGRALSRNIPPNEIEKIQAEVADYWRLMSGGTRAGRKTESRSDDAGGSFQGRDND